MELEGNPKVALGYYRIAFRYDPENRDLCFMLLDRLRESGKIDSAIALGKSCLALAGKPASREYQSVGQAYLRKEDAVSAAEYYREAVALDDDDRDALYVLTGLYEGLGDARYPAALHKLLPLLEYPPHLTDKLLQIFRSRGEIDSIGALLQAAWKKTGQIGYGEELASYYEVRSRSKQLLEVAQQLLEKDSANRSYLLLRAQALKASGMPDSALQAYAELLEKHPSDREARFAYAGLLQEQGRVEEAFLSLKKLVQDFPQSAQYQYALGVSALQTRKPEARAALEKATDLEPAIPDYWARWIYADLVFGEDSVGLSRLSHLPDEGNPGWQTDFFRGLVRVILARLLEPRETPDSTARLDSALARTQRREAAFLFGAALKESPGNRMVLFELGTDLERLGLRDSAMGVFRRLLTIDTLNAVAMNYLGYMLVEDNRDLVYAGALLDRALALDPENPAYLDSKGWWHYRMGNFPAAEVELKKALERMPRDPTVREHLSIIRKLLGEKETVNGADAP